MLLLFVQLKKKAGEREGFSQETERAAINTEKINNKATPNGGEFRCTFYNQRFIWIFSKI